MAAAVGAMSSSSLGLSSAATSCPSLAAGASRTGAQLSATRFHVWTQERHRTAPIPCGPVAKVATSLTQDKLKELAADKGIVGLFLNQNRNRSFHGEMMGHVVRSPFTRRRSQLPRLGVRAMDASVGGEGVSEEYGPPQVFPRINVRDAFKRLGVSRDASEEEIREARNYLSGQYGAHEKSREAIEAAYDKIIMDSFRDRRKSKINLKTSLKKKLADSPPWVRAFTNRVEVPPSQVILQRFALFFLLGVWSVMNPADGGPAFQVAVSLAACIYFLNDRLKSLGRAFLIGFGALIIGWISGSFLVPVLSSYILPTSWSLELSTAVFSYVFLWVACTFLK